MVDYLNIKDLEQIARGALSIALEACSDYGEESMGPIAEAFVTKAIAGRSTDEIRALLMQAGLPKK